jgi:hypothetical protein
MPENTNKKSDNSLLKMIGFFTKCNGNVVTYGKQYFKYEWNNINVSVILIVYFLSIIILYIIIHHTNRLIYDNSGVDNQHTDVLMKHAGCYKSRVCRECIVIEKPMGSEYHKYPPLFNPTDENKRRKNYAIALSIVGIVVSLVYICLHFYAYDTELNFSDQSPQSILIIIHMLLIIFGAIAVSQRFKRCFNYDWTLENQFNGWS